VFNKKSIFILIATILLSGCDKNTFLEDNAKYSTSLFAMDTYITLDLYGENAKISANESETKIKELENLLSTTLETSEIYNINKNSGKQTEIRKETEDIINFAIFMAKKTCGAFDLTIYPVVKEWGFTTGNYKIPEQNVLDNLIRNVGYEKIKISGNKITVPENTQLDLGAMAKGYTSDIVTEIIRNYGVKSGIVNIGGNVQIIGSKPDGSKWKIGLTNPFGDGNVGVLKISDCAVVTSGNYERYFIGTDRKRYCHIIDTKTGKPVDNGIVSVTVIGNEGKKCDALSTALFVMGKDKAIEYQRKNNDFDFILITEDKEIFITPDIANDFAVNDKDMKVNVIKEADYE